MALFLAQDGYGPFANLVATAGTLISVVGALALAWRGRSRWEPSEEDIPAGPQRVGGVVAVAGLVLLWVRYHDAPAASGLVILLVVFVAVCVVALLAYSFLVGTQTYEVKQAVDDRQYRVVKVIGGFRTTPRAAEVLRTRRDATLQQALAGSAYDVDRVWTRSSRAAAKLCFVVAYLLLTVSGTLALASAAILVSNAS
jgi:hypothetical protein